VTLDTSMLAGLTDARRLLERSSTAERVADILRDRITEGALRPGTRLSEDLLGQALGVSRNTLREAFRLLSHERLLVHELNRGVSVRQLTVSDLVDLYRVRRLVEVGVLQEAGPIDAGRLDEARQCVAEAQDAAREGRWLEVGTANVRFHLALAGLADSARVENLMRQILAELRLVFHVMGDLKEFHEPYIVRNAEIVELLATGDTEAAAQTMRTYLLDAEEQLRARLGALTS
jgi:DNA-binding GntR family transcriptional regulator